MFKDYLHKPSESFIDDEFILVKYQVTIYRDDQPVCSGCLINNLHVLTSASCFLTEKSDGSESKKVDQNEVMVVGGTFDLPSHPLKKFKGKAIKLYLLRDYLENPKSSAVDNICVLKVFINIYHFYKKLNFHK